jgi:hypothetical protein
MMNASLPEQPDTNWLTNQSVQGIDNDLGIAGRLPGGLPLIFRFS